MRHFLSSLLLLVPVACQAPPAPTSVSDRLSQPDAPPSAAEPAPAEPAMQPTRAAVDNSAVVARINNFVITSDEFYDLLLSNHGLTVFEQLISLSLVEYEARRRGVLITDSDIQSEYDRALMDMARATTSTETDEPTLLSIGQQLLDEFLRTKNISQSEYLAGMRRNAYLRKMVEGTITIDDEELIDAFKKRFGRKAVVRHIAMGSMTEATEVRRELLSGADFNEMAIRRSGNRISAPTGGLLNPFTSDDTDVPAVIRQIVFRLEPGQISEVVKLEETYQIFKLERFDKPDATNLRDVNHSLRSEIRENKIRRAMQTLERELFRAADIDIQDPKLRQLFNTKYTADRR